MKNNMDIEIIMVVNYAQLDMLYKCHAFTIVGMRMDTYSVMACFRWLELVTRVRQKRAYIVKGETMNRFYGQDNEHMLDPNLNIMCITADDIDLHPLAYRMAEIGGRYFNEVADELRI